MKTRTLFFSPGRAAPGMTLARPVFDKDGHTLLAAGTVLESEILERLTRRGIDVIAILATDPRDTATISEEIRQAEQRIATIFRGEGSAARAELKAAVVAFRRESLQ